MEPIASSLGPYPYCNNIYHSSWLMRLCNLGGWYLDDRSVENNAKVYLRNDKIEFSTSTFTIKAEYQSKGLEEIVFYVLQASVTDDFVLPADPSKSNAPITTFIAEDMVAL